MSLDSYRKRVEELARKRNGDPIFNGSEAHAEIIVENMFANAEDHVNILTGSLNARVYGKERVLGEAKAFLANPEHTVTVLLEDSSQDNLRDNPFYETFDRYPNVSFYSVPEHLHPMYDFHFLEMDGDCYRFESDKTQPAAVASFGDEKGGKQLQDIFGQLRKLSQKLPQRAPAKTT